MLGTSGHTSTVKDLHSKFFILEQTVPHLGLQHPRLLILSATLLGRLHHSKDHQTPFLRRQRFALKSPTQGLPDVDGFIRGNTLHCSGLSTHRSSRRRFALQGEIADPCAAEKIYSLPGFPNLMLRAAAYMPTAA
jgi:hypothetical protein